MPPQIKIDVSILTLIPGVSFYALEKLHSDPLVALVGVCLSVFMVVAIWIFPEAGKKSKK